MDPFDSNMDNLSDLPDTPQEVEDDGPSQSSKQTRSASALSKKSRMSRIGSAKSQKSVVWSIGESSILGSELGLLDKEDEPEKKGNCCFRLVSGKYHRN